MRRRRLLLLGAVVLIGAMGVAGAVRLYGQVGRTPAEIVAYLKHRLKGHNKLEALAKPMLDGVLTVLGEPNPAGAPVPFVVPRLLPNPAVPGGDATPATGRALALEKDTAARVIRVGPGRSVPTIAMAAKIAKDGDTVEIDAGDYVGDVAVWDRAEITIRGIGDRVRVIAGGAHAEGKATWVVRRGKVTIENVDFIGARVPDRNGAGIRLQQGQLTVRHCLFFDNENGILTAGGSDTELVVENSEFAYNGAGDGRSHGLYAGRIRSLKVTGSYFHHGNVGHLIKSRAQTNYIAYNRISDEPGGRSSYELEFPNGGTAQVLGNVIQQSEQTQNSVMVSYGAEGYVWPRNMLFLMHNTLVNDRPRGGTFLKVAPGADLAVARNNLLVGPGLVDAGVDTDGDSRVDRSYFAGLTGSDYRLAGKARQSGALQPIVPTTPELTPRFEYRHRAGLQGLTAPPAWPGAMQTPGP